MCKNYFLSLVIWIIVACPLQAAEITLTKIEQDPIGDVAEVILKEAYAKKGSNLYLSFGSLAF